MNQQDLEYSSGPLALMGLDTPANAASTFIWVLPHLLLSVGGLGLLSWLVERFLSPGIPLGGYAAAMVLAGLVVFFTLALVRGASLRCARQCAEEAEENGQD